MNALGFNNFNEAFNVVGFSILVKPASVKNYRDEFDPFFPNNRKGWHKRPIRPYCNQIFENYKNISFSAFTDLVKRIVYENDEIDTLLEKVNILISPHEDTFAKRLITGQAAEKYFLDNYHTISTFQNYLISDVTKVGCGFDFKLFHQDSRKYLGIEVKGMSEMTGNISLTEKEYATASILKQDYYVFLVKNFKETPFHEYYRDPVKNMNFKKIEKQVIQTNWSSYV